MKKTRFVAKEITTALKVIDAAELFVSLNTADAPYFTLGTPVSKNGEANFLFPASNRKKGESDRKKDVTNFRLGASNFKSGEPNLFLLQRIIKQVQQM